METSKHQNVETRQPPDSEPHEPRASACADTRQPVRWWLVLGGIGGAVLILAYLPGRESIAPLIESDYCHQLIAADRIYDGLGLTSLQPVAPGQPWNWRYDFGLLTQWPPGYSLLIAAIRTVLRCPTIDACRWLSVVSCAAALVGWFVWVKRSVPPGIAGFLLAGIAAGSALPVAFLTNPSTDAILIALLPFTLLFTTEAICRVEAGKGNRSTRSVTVWLALAGATAGGLFWIRYASLFVPGAIASYLFIEQRFRRKIPFRHIATFVLAAMLPVLALLVINHLFGGHGSLQSQFNLGHHARFQFSLEHFAAAWWNFTDLGFYDYHWFTHWVYALAPPGMLAMALCIRSARRPISAFFRTPSALLSTVVVLGLLGMLLGASAVFGDKYDYVHLGRYYLPAKPLYFLLFVGPVLLIGRSMVKLSAVVMFLVAGSWIVQLEWRRPFDRLLTKARQVTSYGQRSVCFAPGASNLYDWLASQNSASLIVFSNFREYVTLETGIPALPIPESPVVLERWLHDVCKARGVGEPRILFVLDPDNRWRSYWMPTLNEVLKTFSPLSAVELPGEISAKIFEYRPKLREFRES